MVIPELTVLSTLLFVLIMLWPMGFLHGYIRGRQGKVYAILKDMGVPDESRAESDVKRH